VRWSSFLNKPASLEAEKAAEALARNSDFHFEIVNALAYAIY
jgi:hypothetical protein